MSEMTLFKSGAVLPDYLRGGADEFTKRLAGGTSGKTISIKGGVWRMMSGGEEVARNEERAMNFVVVNAASDVARTFYEDTYEEGKESTPTCFSADGKTPDASIVKPQASACMNCPQNIAGSGQGTTRACRYSQRFAVVLEGDISGNVYRLQLPAKSLFGKAEGEKMPLQAYAKFLAGHGVPMSGVVTEARFDTSEAVPVLKFRAVRPLTREELTNAQAQGRSEDAAQAVEFKLVVKESTPAPALPPAFKAAPEAPAAAEPTKRATKKPDAPVATKDVSAILDEWGTDDDE
jgi:hypothetical protein